MGEQFEAVGAFGAEPAAGDRRFGIAFDGNQLAVLVKNQLPAADGAIGTNRAGDFRAVILWTKVVRTVAHRFRTGAISGARSDEAMATEAQIP